MNLLDTASLVVTPNGYKASKLYSIIPSDGTGDMTFARTGDTATRVNSSGLIESVLANKPRLDYLGSTCPKLLLEPQRTNLFTYSNDFDNASWGKTFSTVTANATTSPDGTINADMLVEDTTANQQHRLNFTTTSVAGTYTFSLYAKSTERDLFLRIGSLSAFYNLTTGVVSGITAGATATMTNVGNNWFRCTITSSATSTNEICRINLVLKNASSSSSYTGDGISGIYIYGAQFEAGAYATSYIPTTTASVTRNDETCVKSSATTLIGQTEGTVFVDFNNNNTDLITASYKQTLLLINNNTDSTRIHLRIQQNTLQLYFINSSSNVLTITNTISNIRYKIAVSYKSNGVSVYLNGTQLANTTTASIPALNQISIGNYLDNTTTGGFSLGNSINNVSLWKTKLTNSELATLTTI